MTKMATMPIYDKNLLLQKHWTDDLETYNVASGELVL